MRILRYAFLSFLLSTCAVSAKPMIETLSLGYEEVEGLSYPGDVKLIGTTVLGNVTVQGDLFARDAHIHGVLIVHGDALLEDSTLGGRTVVYGGLKSVDSQYIENLELSSQRASFYHSILNTILVFPDKYMSEQSLMLHDATLLKGSVVFKSGQGKIYMDEGCSIRGTIVGGQLFNR